MLAHRQAFPTPRGDGKSDLPENINAGGAPATPGGGAQRLPDVVARRLWWVGTTAQRVPSRKPLGAVVGVQFR